MWKAVKLFAICSTLLASTISCSQIRYSYINPKGELAFQKEFEEAYTFSRDGLAAVKSEGKYGYIDTNGEMKIPPQYDEAAAFSEGRAAVRKGPKYGYIDTKGEKVTELKFDKAGGFSQKLAPVAVEEVPEVIRIPRDLILKRITFKANLEHSSDVLKAKQGGLLSRKTSEKDLYDFSFDYAITPIGILNALFNEKKKSNFLSSFTIYTGVSFGNTAAQIIDGPAISIRSEDKFSYKAGIQFKRCLFNLFSFYDSDKGCQPE